MKANWLPLSAAVALALSSVAASAVDFHGYFRAGAQASSIMMPNQFGKVVF